MPAHGAPDQLASVFESLAALDYPKELLHVFVAVDGPQVDLEDAVRHAGHNLVTLPVQSGSYAARNAAVAAMPSEIPVVLFVDTDVRFGAGWVRAHLEALREAHRSAGPVHFSFRSWPSAAEVVDAARHFDQQRYVTAGFSGAGNLGVRREVLNELTFDPTLRSGGDADFGLRATELGFSLAFTSDAWISHPARSSAVDLLKKVWRVAGGAATLQSRGVTLASRRRGRAPLQSIAASASPGRGRAFYLRVVLLDSLCKLAYAARVPSVVPGALVRVIRRPAAGQK